MHRCSKRSFFQGHTLPAVFLLAVLALAAPSAFSADPDPARETLSQTSTINALKAGLYGGVVPYSQLKQQGDFGMGTVDGLDGEMLALDGEFYQIRFDGTVHLIPETEKAPFAMMTFFDTDTRETITGPLTYKDLVQWLDTKLASTNIFHAIKITGTFAAITTRSVPKQIRPFLPLVEVLKTQSVFPLQNAEGTAVGFRCPSYVKGVNNPAYHLHFITKNLAAGGHVLDFQLQQAVVETDATHSFSMVLPETPDFYAEDLSNERIDRLENPQSFVNDFDMF